MEPFALVGKGSPFLPSTLVAGAEPAVHRTRSAGIDISWGDEDEEPVAEASWMVQALGAKEGDGDSFETLTPVGQEPKKM